MHTVQTKSGLDWEEFKQREGIAAELEQHKKDGCVAISHMLHGLGCSCCRRFLTRQDFLDDVKWREYELERTAKLLQRAS